MQNHNPQIVLKYCWKWCYIYIILLEKLLIYQYILSLNFLDRVQNVNISDCLSCTAGMYCQQYGLAAPTAECHAGYYCPEGQESPKPTTYACSPGHFCEVGSHNETGCPSGYYQPHWKQSTCDLCPAGSYCKAFGKLLVNYFFFLITHIVKTISIKNAWFLFFFINDLFIEFRVYSDQTIWAIVVMNVW